VRKPFCVIQAGGTNPAALPAMSSAHTLEIVEFEPAHQPFFEALNRAWIEKFFRMEPLDYEMLRHPEERILKKGGRIFMARAEGEWVGTATLIRLSSTTYELSKVAVDERFRGRKIGQRLTKTAIEAARDSGGEKIVLYSNKILVPALALYRKLGFHEVPVDGPYERSDIKMELLLT